MATRNPCISSLSLYPGTGYRTRTFFVCACGGATHTHSPVGHFTRLVLLEERLTLPHGAVGAGTMSSITKPLDLIKLSIGERVYIKCRGGRELEGLLHAFDTHLNMVLEDVEETVTTVDIDEETEEELVQSRKRTIEMLFVRGDVVILVSPPLRIA